MKKAIICTSNYQILTAIGMLESYFDNNDNIDLFVCDHIYGSEKLVEKIKLEKIFKNVYHVKERNMNKFIKIIQRCTLNIKGFNKKIDFYDYHELYISVNSKFATIFYEKLKYRNNKLKVYLFEDGVGTYIERFSSGEKGFLSKFLKLIGRDVFEDLIFEKKLLYQPNLDCLENNCVDNIPVINNNAEFLKTINSVFNYTKKNIFYENKIIFFDQLFECESVMDEIKILLNCNSKKLVIKPHPRKENNSLKRLNIEIMNNIPFEILNFNNEIGGKCILATYYSTSVFNTSILCNDCYDILLMYKLIKDNSLKVDKKFSEYVEKFQKNYKGKIYIPNDRNELLNILKSIK